MDTAPHIIVIGGGPAGTLAALSAKKQNPAAHVALLTDEPCEPYEKPPLSKAVLLGTVQPSDAPIAGPGGLTSQGVTLHTSALCKAIDRLARQIILEDGRRLPYDTLVLATGAVAREIPQLPSSMPGVHYLRTAADSQGLKAALGACRDLLVVGGGLIGLEVAAAAAELGVRVTVLEVAPRILARVCYEDISEQVHAAHRRRGVEIRVNTIVRAAQALPGGRVAATINDGETLAADLVVVGTGAKPNDALAEAAGLATRDGIVVDEHARTSDPLIFAAGDAVRFPGPDGPVRLENWRHALEQGAVAGRNAAGAAEVYRTAPSFWSEQYDLYIQGAGWPAAEPERVRRALPGDAALLFEVVGGRVVYALGINAQRDMAAARRLIDRGVVVDTAALSDPAQPLASLLKR